MTDPRVYLVWYRFRGEKLLDGVFALRPRAAAHAVRKNGDGRFRDYWPFTVEEWHVLETEPPAPGPPPPTQEGERDA